MENALSLPLLDRDNDMRRVARELAMELVPIDKILESCNVGREEFERWQKMPQFITYYRQFKEEWHAASNAIERTKIKAGLVMEDFMEEAYRNLHDKRNPLNQRTELGKLVAKIAGMGEPKVAIGNGGGGGGGFSLSINITQTERVSISPQKSHKVIDHDSYDDDDDDDFDPFTSPVTINEAAE